MISYCPAGSVPVVGVKYTFSPICKPCAVKVTATLSLQLHVPSVSAPTCEKVNQYGFNTVAVTTPSVAKPLVASKPVCHPSNR